eukprot:CAMPEP_0167757996 /NCGR_PEP_ID=MMETSP0110_2-20121227/10229_1 /TAXON_ID=629695 /ORGANISM="Gymnochlora sp., Strain CCMP2014" /LENGTH=106 /DNA_ID=CAMNT_0007644235 /DNA_START=24 /DNA_END=344 /DNA_ORIENTATION=+
MARFLQRVWKWGMEAYSKRIFKDLDKYGLRYDDLLIETDPDVITAINRLPARERALRQMRLKRALDIELKHSYIPVHMRGKQGPHRYLTPFIEQARKERLEKENNL